MWIWKTTSRAWQPTPVFLSGESPWTKPGSYSPRGHRVRHHWVTKHSKAYRWFKSRPRIWRNVTKKKWVCLLIGIKPKDTQPSHRWREGRIYYLQQVRRTLGIFPKAISPQQQNWGSFKLRVHAYSWRGLSRGEFSIVLEQRLTESRLYLIEVMRVRKSTPKWEGNLKKE